MAKDAAMAVAMDDETCTTDYVVIEGITFPQKRKHEYFTTLSIGSSSDCSVTDSTSRYCGGFLADSNIVKANSEICGKPIYK